MTTEDKELLLKDLCGRLPYRPYVMIEGYYGQLMSIELSDKWLPGVITTTLARFEYNPENIKPYLRRMSSMTEEERVEFKSLGGVMSYSPQHDHWAISALSSEAYDWLNAHHFDYRGLISKGLAIEVTKENNPYK